MLSPVIQAMSMKRPPTQSMQQPHMRTENPPPVYHAPVHGQRCDNAGALAQRNALLHEQRNDRAEEYRNRQRNENAEETRNRQRHDQAEETRNRQRQDQTEETKNRQRSVAAPKQMQDTHTQQAYKSKEHSALW